MLKRLISSLFRREAQYERYGLDNLNDDVIGYPPTPQGIPVVQTSVLLERMEEDIKFIQCELGLSDDEFDTYVKPVMIRFIEVVDLLPASEYKHHSTGGGLVYHSFDVAKRAMRAAQHTQYPATNVSQAKTQQSNRHWKTASVLSALLHDGGKVVSDISVWNGDSENPLTWDAHSDQTINQWAKQHKLGRYYIKYMKNRHQKHHNASISMMQRIIPKQTWSWLGNSEDGKAIHNTMLEAVSGNNPSHPMCQIVSKSDAESVKHDMLHNHSHVTKEIKRTPLSELLADLIKHRVLNEQWLVNQKNAKLWFIDDEIYVLWEASVSELVEELLTAGYMIPAVPDVLARICIEEGMAIAYDADTLYTPLKPEILGTKAKPVTLNCLKFNRVERLIPSPEKLYSLKEHPSKKKASEKVEQVSNPVGPHRTDNQVPGSAKSAGKDSSSGRFETFRTSMASILTALTTITPKQYQESSSADFNDDDKESSLASSLEDIDQRVYFEHPIARKLFELGYQVDDGKVVIEQESLAIAMSQLESAGFNVNPM
ncbi:MobH family relaxase, partial [Vibrio mediterranei]|uniref:MobH family relaxase n=1 Tax=Vibrio mediterranei TaxID=689 RepID=UPI00406780A5